MANPTGETVPITPRLESLLLKWTNEYRNRVAGGQLTYFKPAYRMKALVCLALRNSMFKSLNQIIFQTYDKVLEQVAWYNAIRCYIAHDQVRITPEFSSVGQNLGIKYTYPNYDDLEDTLHELIKEFFDEHIYCKMSQIRKFKQNSSSKK